MPMPSASPVPAPRTEVILRGIFPVLVPFLDMKSLFATQTWNAWFSDYDAIRRWTCPRKSNLCFSFTEGKGKGKAKAECKDERHEADEMEYYDVVESEIVLEFRVMFKHLCPCACLMLRCYTSARYYPQMMHSTNARLRALYHGMVNERFLLCDIDSSNKYAFFCEKCGYVGPIDAARSKCPHSRCTVCRTARKRARRQRVQQNHQRNIVLAWSEYCMV